MKKIITSFKRIIHISRPRFWLYEFATFLCFGVFAALSKDSVLPEKTLILCLLWGIYFLIPANILIYGINDIYDYETDKLNPKKVEYEALVTPHEAKTVWKWVYITTIPFLFLIPFLPISSILPLSFFFFFAVFYSAKPIRAKARPFFDALFSAGHYVSTGVFGYYLAFGQHFPMLGILAGVCWCIAMHAFSAVPDIQADTDAGLETIATRLGYTRTIYVCSILYSISGLLVFFVQPTLAIFWVTFYISVMLYTLKNKEQLFLIYKHFPVINGLCGMSFCLFILHRLLF